MRKRLLSSSFWCWFDYQHPACLCNPNFRVFVIHTRTSFPARFIFLVISVTKPPRRINPSIHAWIRPKREKIKIKKSVLTSAHDSPCHCHQTPTRTCSSAASAPKPQNCPADHSAPSSPSSSAAVLGTYRVGEKEICDVDAPVAASPFRSSSAERCTWCLTSCRTTSGAIHMDDCYCPTRWPTDGV